MYDNEAYRDIQSFYMFNYKKRLFLFTEPDSEDDRDD